MTDFRARCDQLVQAIDKYPVKPKAHRDLCNEVRAELEQTGPREPTNDDLMLFAHQKWIDRGYRSDMGGVIHYEYLAYFARAVLERWGGAA